MSKIEKPTGDEIHRVCNYLAMLSDAMGNQSGTAGLEAAGTYVSVCAIDPDFSREVAEKGNGAAIDNIGTFDAMMNGCLSYTARNGKILTPSQARFLAHGEQLS